MIITDSWAKVQRGINFVSLGLLAAFWILFLAPVSRLVGVILAGYMAYQAYLQWKQDEADERMDLIATRAGFLSQKLMFGVGIVLLTMNHRLPGNGNVALLIVLATGSVAQEIFRRMQGVARHPNSAPAWAWGVVVLAFLAFAGYIFWAYHAIMTNFGY